MAHAKHRAHSQQERVTASDDRPVDESAVVPEEQAAEEEQDAGSPARLSLIVWLLGFLFLASIVLYDLAKALIRSLLQG